MEFENMKSSNLRKDLNLDNPDVVYGKKVCYSNAVKWLGISNMYEKFHRPNHYDIGGTYIGTEPDFWISCKTERVGDIFLLHIFIYRKDFCSFQIALSYGNNLNVDRKSNTVHLSLTLKDYVIKNLKLNNKPGSFIYITTYSFSDHDIEILKDKNFFISINFPKLDDIDINLLNDIKCNYNYGELLTDPVSSDFIIESSDNEKFSVHKTILSMHSEVFKAMFKEETTESKNNYVKLGDVNGEDLKYFLEFIYTGSIKEMNNVDFIKLLTLSDLYNIQGLWRLCQNTLAIQLTTSNALYTLAIAHMYDSKILKNETFKFIKKNVEVLKTDDFKQITDVDLMRELCEYLACTY